MLGLIAVLSMTYAQNTTGTPSNATTAESHTSNTTGLLLMQPLLLSHHRHALQKIPPL